MEEENLEQIITDRDRDLSDQELCETEKADDSAMNLDGQNTVVMQGGIHINHQDMDSVQFGSAVDNEDEEEHDPEIGMYVTKVSGNIFSFKFLLNLKNTSTMSKKIFKFYK